MTKPFPHGPAGRDVTVRDSLHRALLNGARTARDLSKVAGIPEHEVPGHLEHLERSLKHKGERLVMEPAACLECGFTFTQRRRYTRPGSCPECRSRRISLPVFSIET